MKLITVNAPARPEYFKKALEVHSQAITKEASTLRVEDFQYTLFNISYAPEGVEHPLAVLRDFIRQHPSISELELPALLTPDQYLSLASLPQLTRIEILGEHTPDWELESVDEYVEKPFESDEEVESEEVGTDDYVMVDAPTPAGRPRAQSAP